MFDPLDVWKKGDPLHHDHLNQAVEVLNRLGNLTGGEGINVFQTPGGTTIEARQPPPPQQRFWVKLTGAEAGSGKYKGVLARPANQNTAGVANPTVSPSINLTRGEFCSDVTTVADEEILICNLAEAGLEGHMLGRVGLENQFPNYLAVWSDLMTDEEPPRRVALIESLNILDCSEA